MSLAGQFCSPIDLGTYAKVRESKQTKAAGAHLGSATLYHTGARRIIGNYADWHVNQASLPTALISL
jgi:hypothetical protein